MDLHLSSGQFIALNKANRMGWVCDYERCRLFVSWGGLSATKPLSFPGNLCIEQFSSICCHTIGAEVLLITIVWYKCSIENAANVSFESPFYCKNKIILIVGKYFRDAQQEETKILRAFFPAVHIFKVSL